MYKPFWLYDGCFKAFLVNDIHKIYVLAFNDFTLEKFLNMDNIIDLLYSTIFPRNLYVKSLTLK